jgi:SulP family sulfate permease
MLSNLVQRLKAGGITLGLCGIKRQVMEVIERIGLTAEIGVDNIFPTDVAALGVLLPRLSANH